ncbi:hypothetical protein EDD28_0100 [Salana multivorans]|uniref:Uncharacterized protein n=1 Tax=Salana multivorans TaxID=120377 RepID=A0A3N2D6R1_9MICO|nr:hypothetical protein EDD28_0012 [Salana multivorans]ROR95543.1 hypothetical protein EDD28_0100 [Salana multivorans]
MGPADSLAPASGVWIADTDGGEWTEVGKITGPLTSPTRPLDDVAESFRHLGDVSMSFTISADELLKRMHLLRWLDPLSRARRRQLHTKYNARRRRRAR